MYGKAMSSVDELMPDYYRLCLEADEPPPSDPYTAKREFARRLVERWHGAEAAAAAEAGFDRMFRDKRATDDAPVLDLPDGDPVHVPAFLADHALAALARRGAAADLAGRRASERGAAGCGRARRAPRPDGRRGAARRAPVRARRRVARVDGRRDPRSLRAGRGARPAADPVRPGGVRPDVRDRGASPAAGAGRRRRRGRRARALLAVAGRARIHRAPPRPRRPCTWSSSRPPPRTGGSRSTRRSPTRAGSICRMPRSTPSLLLGPDLPPADAGRPRRRAGGGGRVVRPGGPVFAAAISRWAPRLHGEVAMRLLGGTSSDACGADRGASAPDGCRRSSPARSAASATGRTTSATRCSPRVSSASISWEWRASRLRSPISRSGWPRPEARAVVLDAARALERVPELLGLSPHLLATARRHPRFVLG